MKLMMINKDKTDGDEVYVADLSKCIRVLSRVVRNGKKKYEYLYLYYKELAATEVYCTINRRFFINRRELTPTQIARLYSTDFNPDLEDFNDCIKLVKNNKLWEK